MPVKPRKRVLKSTQAKQPASKPGNSPVNKLFKVERSQDAINQFQVNSASPQEMDDTQLVVFTLRSILQDTNASGAAKASAARTLAEMAGALGKNAKPPADKGKPLASLTREELEAELANEG
jgi:hypothetical protein